MPVATAPTRPLYRIGPATDPLHLPPWSAVGRGRFDYPQARFRVLYTSVQRQGCFLETLAAFRPKLAILAQIVAVTGASVSLPNVPLPLGWERQFAVGRLRLAPDQRWLDLRDASTREMLRAALAPLLLQLGLTDMDAGTIREPRRAITQAMAAWAYEQGFHGVIYPSRLDDRVTCWAIFEGAVFRPVGAPEPITRDDPDLLAAATRFRLTF